MTTVQRDVGRFAGGFGVVAATCAAVLCRCPDHRVHTGGNYGIIPTFQPSTQDKTESLIFVGHCDSEIAVSLEREESGR
jgi:hypothetical protein